MMFFRMKSIGILFSSHYIYEDILLCLGKYFIIDSFEILTPNKLALCTFMDSIKDKEKGINFMQNNNAI